MSNKSRDGRMLYGTTLRVNRAALTSFVINYEIDNVNVIIGGRVMYRGLALRVRVLQARCVRKVQALEIIDVTRFGCLIGNKQLIIWFN